MDKPKSRKNKLVVQNTEDETLIYDLKNNLVFCLNQTSSLVWQFCDGKNSIADIANLISQELKTLVSEDFVLLALNELNKQNLLEKEAGLETYFQRFNRREVIKKVGLASMIALPLIASVTAPKAVNAASCPPGGIPAGSNVFAVQPNVPGDPHDCITCSSSLAAQCCSHTFNTFSCTEIIGQVMCSAICS